MKLNEFLVKAKIATYASAGEAEEERLEDGGKQFVVSDGNWRYRDRYYGSVTFVGEELVWDEDRLVWSMNYFGKISSGTVDAEEVYGFLRDAMKKVREDRPFRGPASYRKGDFEYFDESTGDIDNFSGTERILLNGQEVYKLHYHGGSM